MKPRIDIAITDTNGAYSSLADGIEPYEVYVNNEPVCTPKRLDELESENNKLRERMEWLEDELRKQGSTSATFMEMIRAYQEDNKKLRELVHTIWLAGDFRAFLGVGELEGRMRELGIEASE